MRYAIVDIETTGGNARTDRVIDVAVIVYDGEQVVEEFQSLINPERAIPYSITQLTGISNDMVINAPRFYEVAKRVVEITDTAVFVAHNAQFDYNFLRQEFKQLGYDYNRKTLCTVKLSREVMPGLPTYSLGKLCRHLGIANESRHRAYGDAKATLHLWQYMQHLPDRNEVFRSLIGGEAPQKLNNYLTKQDIDDLPSDAGVYYFRSATGQLLYVGQSGKIRKRIHSHFRNNDVARAIEMREHIASIDYELTGNEVVAQLLESEEIKKLKPIYNRAGRRAINRYGLYSHYTLEGYLEFTIQKTSKGMAPHLTFSHVEEGRNFLRSLAERRQLCLKLCGLYKSEGGCFNYMVKKCHGACCGEESYEQYNERARGAIEGLPYMDNHFMMIMTGRTETEKSVVWVHNGRYVGYGFFDTAMEEPTIDNLKACVKPRDDNRDIQHIIRLAIRRKQYEKFLHLLEE